MDTMDKLRENFLSRTETTTIQQMYTMWIRHLKPEVLSQKLYSSQLIDEYEYQTLTSLRTVNEKSQHIFHQVLIKATYSDLKIIRRALLDTRHFELAKLLPRRDGDLEDIDYEMTKPQCKTIDGEENKPGAFNGECCF